MKNIVIALVINVGLLIWSLTIFLSKGIQDNTHSWKFYSSLTGVFTFLVIVVILSIKFIKYVRNMGSM